MSGSIIVLDDSGQPVESAIIHGAQLHDQTTRQLRVTLERGLAGWVINNRQPALVNDTSRDERWVRRPDDSEDRTCAKSAVSAPLLAREQIVGVITLGHPQVGFFSMEHLEVVQAIADQAGIAVLNARLYADTHGASGQTLQMQRDNTSGTWSIAGSAAWDRMYYLYEVEVFARYTGEIETFLVTAPYSLSLAMDSRRSQIVDLDDPALDTSGYGIKNLAGNVREWTASESTSLDDSLASLNTVLHLDDKPIYYPVIVRGGAWINERSTGMSSIRGTDGTIMSRETLGFRCVCPPGKTCDSPWDWRWIWFGKY